MKVLRRYGSPFLFYFFLASSLSLAETQSSAMSPDQQRVMLLGLIQSLHHDAASAQQAAQALGRMGPEASPAAGDLVQALQFDEDAVYLAASDALVKIGDPSLAPLTLVLGHPNFMIRQRAALILARFGAQARRATPALVDLLSDSQGSVRQSAQKALIQIGDPAIPALKESLKAKNSGDRDIFLVTLGHLGPKAIPILLDRLQNDENVYIRGRAADILGQRQEGTPEIQQGLIQALSDLDENVRVESCNALANLKPAATAAIGPLLVISLSDHDAFAQKRAAQALTQIGPATRDSLPGLAAAERHENPDVRRLVIDILGKSALTWPDGQSIFLSAIKDPDPKVRLRVVQVSALKAKHGSESLPIFRQAMADPISDIRAEAIAALGQWKDNGTVAASEISGALRDLNTVVREQAIAALGNLGVSGLPGLLQALSDSSSMLSDQAGNAIVALGQEALPALQSLQKGPDIIMQKKASVLLRRIERKSHAKKRKQNGE